MEKILIAYIPVLHDGYKKLLDAHKDASTIYILGKDIVSEIEYLAKEIRALDPELVRKSLNNWGLQAKIEILDSKIIEKIQGFSGEVVSPDDDVSHLYIQQKFPKAKITFDKVFLRWDKRNSVRENKIANDQIITSDEFSKKMIACAEEEAEKSSDWWRRVGAVIVKDSKIILVGHNQHVPSEYTPYVNGDPRNCFHKGEFIELSSVVHAEAGLIAEAARKGISLEGTEIYVTTFPCPPCAKLIAYSGIKKIYYKEGYGVLDGEGIMKEKGIEIYFVQ